MATSARTAFLRNWAVMIDAGLSISHCLETLARQHKGRLARAARRMQERIEGGATLAEAAEEHPHMFSQLEITLLRAGEVSGSLDRVLLRLADRQEARGGMIKRLITKLIYPAILLHAAILLPGFTAWFQGQSPLSVLLQVMRPLGVIYGVLICAWLIYRHGDSVKPLRRSLDFFLYHIPIIGGLIRNTGTARFARTFAALYNAGVSVLDALPMAAKATGNAVMERRILAALPTVQEGKSFSEAMSASRAFGPVIDNMLAVGEESGKLDEMLDKIAENADLDAQTSLERMGTIIPLIIYGVIALYVAMTIIHMFTDVMGSLQI